MSIAHNPANEGQAPEVLKAGTALAWQQPTGTSPVVFEAPSVTDVDAFHQAATQPGVPVHYTNDKGQPCTVTVLQPDEFWPLYKSTNGGKHGR